MGFFGVNMPYGISKNSKGEWMAFNRNYLPLGHSKQPSNEHYHVLERKSINLPVYSKYHGLTEDILLKLAANDTSIETDDTGDICVVWFYTDGANPLHNKDNFDSYSEKLEILSKLSIQ